MSVSIDDVYAKHETEKGVPNKGALLCVIAGDEYWIPKSQITDDSEVWEDGQRGELVITDYIAGKKGLS